MSDPTIAFLPQPVETLAREGKSFAQRVIHTLHGWVHSNRTDHVVSELRKRIFILNDDEADWNMVVIVREGHHRADWSVDVCSVDFSEPDSLMQHFKSLADVDELASVMQVRLNKIEPMMFSAVAGSFGLEGSRALYKSSTHHRTGVFQLMHTFDSNAHRWASSKARNNFKALLEDARKRPQLVEREGDELFVVSRRYLQETIEPTSAQGMSRLYRAMALTEDDMPDPAPRALTPLEDLPELH